MDLEKWSKVKNISSIFLANNELAVKKAVNFFFKNVFLLFLVLYIAYFTEFEIRLQVSLAIRGGYVPLFFECEQRNREYQVQVSYISRGLGSTKFQCEQSKPRIAKPRIARATCIHHLMWSDERLATETPHYISIFCEKRTFET